MSSKYYENKHRKSRHFIIFITILILTTSFCTYYLHKKYISTPETKATTTQIESVKPRPTLQSMNGHYLFNGTIFWGRGIENWSKKSDGTLDFTRPFSALSSFHPEKYDAWEADLECPITTRNSTFQKQFDTLVFNCRPEYTPEMAKYFQIINLANNHTDNRGMDGLEETRSNLAKAGVQYFGSYDPAIKEDICEVIALPVQINNLSSGSAPEGQKKLLPIAFCSWHYVYRKPLPSEIEEMQTYQKIMPVFAFIHMGREYLSKADNIQREIAHQVADQNPEFVIANNPHWVQDSEVYKGKLIVYSTGNFIFDQLDFETQRSASIDLKIESELDDNLNKWLDIGEHCKTYKDNCLNEITAANLPKPKLKLSFDVIAGDSSGKLTKYTPSLQQGIYDRLNWSQTSKELSK